MAAYLLFEKKRLAYGLLALGIPMLVARVLSGVHYPGDVIVGFVLGVAFSAISVRFVNSSRFRSSLAYAFPLRVATFFKL